MSSEWISCDECCVCVFVQAGYRVWAMSCRCVMVWCFVNGNADALLLCLNKYMDLLATFCFREFQELMLPLPKFESWISGEWFSQQRGLRGAFWEGSAHLSFSLELSWLTMDHHGTECTSKHIWFHLPWQNLFRFHWSTFLLLIAPDKGSYHSRVHLFRQHVTSRVFLYFFGTL
jgi:hypothetical protein